MNKILLVEDDESVNRGLSFALNREGYCVLSCGTVKEARHLFETERPQMMICDITLPDGNGLDLVKSLRGRTEMYIICLTALDQETDFVMGYEAGADDYVAKPFSLSVLTLKVEAFFGRQKKGERNEIVTGDLVISLGDGKVKRGSTEICLTRNEWKLLKYFLDNPRQILSKNQMLERLFDADGGFADENTVAVNIRRLREKVERDSSEPEFIKNIRGMGYLWDADCEKR